MKTLCRAMAIAACGIFLVLGAYATGKGEVAGKAAPVELSILAWDRGTTPSTQGTIESNWWVDYVNEQLKGQGVKVRFVPIPRATEGEKLSTMLAAGDAPDISFTYNTDLLNLYVKNGGLIDFTDMVSKYAPRLPKYFSAEDFDAGKINGRQYSFAYKTLNFGNFTWIRKDWMDKLGLKEPETVDEFYSLLKQFKTRDPGGVGDRLIPFELPQSVNNWDVDVMPGFMDGYADPEKLVTPHQLWPEAKPTLKFLNKLFNEGLLADMVLDKQGEQEKQRFVRGEIGSVVQMGHWPFHPAYGSLFMKLQENVPTATLMGASPWRKTTSQKKYVSFSGVSYYAYRLFSPVSNKHPEAALAFIDWIGSDGTFPFLLGVEGKDYRLVENFPQIIDSKQFAERVSWVQPQYPGLRYLFTDNPSNWARYYSMYFAREQDKSQWLSIVPNVMIGKLEYKNIVMNAEMPVRTKVWPLINSNWINALPKIVLAPADKFDQVFDQAVKEFSENGGDAVAKEAVETYRKIYRK